MNWDRLVAGLQEFEETSTMLAHSSSVSTSPKFIITCLSSVLEMNPLPANPELHTKCTLPPNYLRDPQNQPSISKTQKASRMSTSAVRASTYVESLILWQNTPPGFLHYHHCWSIFSWYHLFFKTSLGRIVIVWSVLTLLAIRSRKAGNL